METSVHNPDLNIILEIVPAIRTGAANPAVRVVIMPPAMVRPPPTTLTLVPMVLLT